MTGNKGKMFLYAPLLLPATALSLFLLTFLINKNFSYGPSLVWLPWVVFQVLVNTACGILLRILYREANTDTLTGLNNRKSLHESLARSWRNKPAALLFLDVDNFKSINDNYGHLAGDEALRQLAGIIKSHTRKQDIVARWGGEEFALILPSTSEAEARRVAERIRKAVENYCFKWDNATFRLTVSVGIAVAGEGTDPAQFFKPADKALARAKEKKNCVISLSSLG